MGERMLLVAQFPIGDARPFVAEALRVKAPAWPLADPQREFVRCFGRVRRRCRGPGEYWSDELYYASAAGALRIPHLESVVLGRGVGAVSPRCAFRRVFSDGLCVARLEVGIADDGDNYLNAKDCIRIVSDFLEMSTEVTSFRGPRVARALVRQGGPLAQLYHDATTPTLALGRAGGAPNLVAPGDPMVLVEHRGELRSLDERFRRVDLPAITDAELHFTWLLNNDRRVGIWVINATPVGFRTIRNLRLCLFRLHAERQVLREVLRRISARILRFRAGTPEGERLEGYLNKATRLIARDRFTGILQAGLREAMATYDQLMTRDELPLLLDQLARARRQIRKKVEDWAQAEQRRATSGYTVINGNPTIVEGNMKVRIEFGSGNTFHGDVVSAGIIERSFNKATEYDKDEEVQTALRKLATLVAKLCETLDEGESQQTARNLGTFVGEATSSNPQASLLRVTGEGLVNAAKTVAALAQPIAKTVTTILEFLAP